MKTRLLTTLPINSAIMELDYLVNLPYPTIPLFLTPHVGGLMYKNPLASASKSSFGRTFDGGDCFAAGPSTAMPVSGS